MDHPNTLALDEFIAGELEGAELAAMRSHLTECASCSQYVTALMSEQEKLMQTLPPSEFALHIQRQANLAAPPAKSRRWLWWVVPAMTAAIVAMFVTTRSVPSPQMSPSAHPQASDDIRWMGSNTINVRVLAKRKGNVVELHQAPLAKDQLQIECRANDPNSKYFAAVFVFEAGNVQPVLPSATLKPFEFQGAGWIPGSIVLDVEKPGTELFVVVRSKAFNMETVATDLRMQLANRRNLPLNVEGLIYRTVVELP